MGDSAANEEFAVENDSFRYILVGGLEHFLFSHRLGIIIYNHPNWLIFFRGVAQPPTSTYYTYFKMMIFHSSFCRSQFAEGWSLKSMGDVPQDSWRLWPWSWIVQEKLQDILLMVLESSAYNIYIYWPPFLSDISYKHYFEFTLYSPLFVYFTLFELTWYIWSPCDCSKSTFNERGICLRPKMSPFKQLYILARVLAIAMVGTKLLPTEVEYWSWMILIVLCDFSASGCSKVALFSNIFCFFPPT